MVVLREMHNDEEGNLMSRSGRNWAWLLLGVWLVVLMALADAKAQEKPVKAAEPTVTFSVTPAEASALLAAWDKAQASGAVFFKDRAAYLALVKKANEAHKAPEGTDYSIGLGQCKTGTGGSVTCTRVVSPVLPKPAEKKP